MKSSLDQIVNTVLYEGHILYPYRSSSIRNRGERITFGRVYPKDYSHSQKGAEPFVNQTECLLHARGKSPEVEVTVRFLHPMWREVGTITEGKAATFGAVPEMVMDGVIHQSWQEATERQVTLSLGPLEDSQTKLISSPITFHASCMLEPLSMDSGETIAAIRRRQEGLQGVVEIEATPAGPEVFKISVKVSNRTPLSTAHCGDQEAVLMRTFASTHTILHTSKGEFISLLDPPAKFKGLADQCKNIGTWPVLAGDESKPECDTMLSSPIILRDYPHVAPESGGNLEGAELTTAQDPLKLHPVMRGVTTAREFFYSRNPLRKVLSGGREPRTETIAEL